MKHSINLYDPNIPPPHPTPPQTLPRLYSVHINIIRVRMLHIGYRNKKDNYMLPYACKYYNNLAVRFVCGAKEAKICK